MGHCMAFQDVTEARIPFVDERVDLLSAEAVILVVSLILGMTIWQMTGDIGSTLASKLNQLIGSIVGTNPGTGEPSDSVLGGAFD